MEASENHYSPSSPPTSPPPPPPVILSPCAACKILRRRCVEKCILAPYFPPTEPLKFTTAHRVFGASNIIKFLQELPENQRTDAVSSMVYEANARIRDPVYGCAGAICQLQKQVTELQAQLAMAQAELVNLQAQHGNLIAIVCAEMARAQQQQCSPPPSNHNVESAFEAFVYGTQGVVQDDVSFSEEDQFVHANYSWEPEPLWT